MIKLNISFNILYLRPWETPERNRSTELCNYFKSLKKAYGLNPPPPPPPLTFIFPQLLIKLWAFFRKLPKFSIVVYRSLRNWLVEKSEVQIRTLFIIQGPFSFSNFNLLIFKYPNGTRMFHATVLARAKSQVQSTPAKRFTPNSCIC